MKKNFFLRLGARKKCFAFVSSLRSSATPSPPYKCEYIGKIVWYSCDTQREDNMITTTVDKDNKSGSYTTGVVT